MEFSKTKTEIRKEREREGHRKKNAANVLVIRYFMFLFLLKSTANPCNLLLPCIQWAFLYDCDFYRVAKYPML